MKNKFYKVAFLGLILLSSSSHANSIVDDTELSLEKLCPPTRTHPRDLGISTPEGQKKLPLYYLSEIIGIKLGDEPPYDAFKNPQLHEDDIIRFGKIMMSMADDPDACDKNGIKYIAKFYKYFCPVGKAFQDLPPKNQDELLVYFDLFMGPMQEVAKQVSNCSHFNK